MRPTRSRFFPSLPTLAVALVVVLAGCARAGAPAASGPSGPTASTTGPTFPVTVTDDDGVTVTIDAPPSRIVTFAPSATEIVYALGIGDRLVGVSGPFDDHPPAARRVEEIGGAGEFGVDPNLEKVVSLQPDLFLTIAGGDRWKERLRDLGVPVFTIDSTDLDDVAHDVETVGRLTGATDAAAEVASELLSQADQVEQRVAGEPAVSCFFEVFYPPLLTVGPDTFIGDLLDRAGCDSVSDHAKTDYPTWSVDDLVREDPRVYLVSSESGVTARAVAERPGFGAVGAVAGGRVVLIDSDLVSRPGPRIAAGLRLLAEALHPEAFA